MNRQQKVIKGLAAACDIGVHIHSPEGTSRYSFTNKSGSRDLSPVLISYREALIWIDGYKEALERGKS